MGIKAITIDLYGTLVKNNDILMKDICKRVNSTSRVYESTAAKVGITWWKFQKEFTKICHGEKFLNQRELEKAIINRVLDLYKSRMDPYTLLEEILSAMKRPRAFDDSRFFLARLPLPCLIIANGDRDVVKKAVEFAGLGNVSDIVCSQDAKAYKPNTRIFSYAIDKLGLCPEEVLHVGDSIQGDVWPAQKIGMKTVYINRYSQKIPDDFECDMMCNSLVSLRGMIR